MNEPDQRSAVVDVSCVVAALESELLALEPIFRAAATHPHKTPAHAAICIDNGVTEFITNDSGFEKFTELRIRNPFAA